ncbi:MAG: primosomal protein N' [Proteobacteria bacterium]|nr:MAG: primosomal protein N' [Pseudomonadota bacterium]
MSKVLVDVAPLAPVPGPLTYRVPPELAPLVAPGVRVTVPLGEQGDVLAIVARWREGAAPVEAGRIRAVRDVLDERPSLPPTLVELLLWAARYYCAPPGEMLRAALPSLLTQQQSRRQRLRSTEAGAEALAAQGALLRRQDLDLSPRERALLARLAQAKGPISRRMALRDFGAATVSQLAQRGFIEVVLPQPKRRRGLLLERLEEGQPLAKNAHQQRALLAQVEAAGGSVRLGELPNRPKDARKLARQLAAKGWLRLSEVELAHDPFAQAPIPEDQQHRLTHDQRAALARLEERIGTSSAEPAAFAPFLLHGVTGSGKTEVYLRLIARVLERTGRGAIVLVPEIALTPQLAARFRARFGREVAVLHSGLSESARHDQWRRLRDGELRIVVGARSAIFAPLCDLGVVIVDEEHDPSFKQEEGVRYNARDLALLRGQRAGALVVLGSATPSLESRRAVEEGRLTLCELPRRATPRPLPQVELVDLRQHSTAPDGMLSAPLAAAIDQALAAREQTILFLNRRGFSPQVQCRGCGHVFQCEHCSVSLTHHRRQQRLICHYCGFGQITPERCPSCGAPELSLRGFGTERVEEVLTARFPRARVARLDRDTAAGAGLARILDGIRRREIDILVGTQMVTKGHDFPHVTLVGVLSADQGLHFPDFRGAERTFQLLTQVAGRAGRGERPGRVLVQTFSPEHPAIVAACRHDYRAFSELELAARRELSYPPFAYIAALHLDGEDPAAVAAAAARLGQTLAGPAGEAGVSLLGPAEAPLSRLKGRSRWMLLLKAPQRAALRAVLDRTRQEPCEGGVRLGIDVDPVQML